MRHCISRSSLFLPFFIAFFFRLWFLFPLVVCLCVSLCVCVCKWVRDLAPAVDSNAFYSSFYSWLCRRVVVLLITSRHSRPLDDVLFAHYFYSIDNHVDRSVLYGILRHIFNSWPWFIHYFNSIIQQVENWPDSFDSCNCNFNRCCGWDANSSKTFLSSSFVPWKLHFKETESKAMFEI